MKRVVLWIAVGVVALAGAVFLALLWQDPASEEVEALARDRGVRSTPEDTEESPADSASSAIDAGGAVVLDLVAAASPKVERTASEFARVQRTLRVVSADEHRPIQGAVVAVVVAQPASSSEMKSATDSEGNATIEWTVSDSEEVVRPVASVSHPDFFAASIGLDVAWTELKLEPRCRVMGELISPHAAVAFLGGVWSLSAFVMARDEAGEWGEPPVSPELLEVMRAAKASALHLELDAARAEEILTLIDPAADPEILLLDQPVVDGEWQPGKDWVARVERRRALAALRFSGPRCRNVPIAGKRGFDLGELHLGDHCFFVLQYDGVAADRFDVEVDRRVVRVGEIDLFGTTPLIVRVVDSAGRRMNEGLVWACDTDLSHRLRIPLRSEQVVKDGTATLVVRWGRSYALGFEGHYSEGDTVVEVPERCSRMDARLVVLDGWGTRRSVHVQGSKGEPVVAPIADLITSNQRVAEVCVGDHQGTLELPAGWRRGITCILRASGFQSREFTDPRQLGDVVQLEREKTRQVELTDSTEPVPGRVALLEFGEGRPAVAEDRARKLAVEKGIVEVPEPDSKTTHVYLLAPHRIPVKVFERSTGGWVGRGFNLSAAVVAEISLSGLPPNARAYFEGSHYRKRVRVTEQLESTEKFKLERWASIDVDRLACEIEVYTDAPVGIEWLPHPRGNDTFTPVVGEFPLIPLGGGRGRCHLPFPMVKNPPRMATGEPGD